MFPTFASPYEILLAIFLLLNWQECIRELINFQKKKTKVITEVHKEEDGQALREENEKHKTLLHGKTGIKGCHSDPHLCSVNK